jgi:hypothetical protein
MKLSKEVFNELVLELEQTPKVNEKEWRERVSLTNDWEPVDVGDSWITTTKVIHYSFRNPNLNKILEELSGRSIRDCLTLHTVEAVPPQATVPHKDLYSEVTLNILLEDDCEGGYLYVEGKKIEEYEEKGDYVIYEGRNKEHSVTAITKGKRKALIVWFGPIKSLL